MKSKRAREAAEVDDTNPSPVDAAEIPAKKRKVNVDGAKKEKKNKEKKQLSGDADEDEGGEPESKPKKQKKEDKYKREKESRRERKDKKKDLQNLPGDAEDEEEEQQTQEPTPAVHGDKAVNGEDGKKEKKDKKDKKEKKEKKSKKEKKKAAKQDSTATAETNGTSGSAQAEAGTEEGGDAIDLDASTASKQDRHIVFVGNLPYTATAASISAHFASLNPVAVRCLKNKGDDKPCRGIAFVEFGLASHMRTCLDKFHHSEFNDGLSSARRINVELTAGGGGKAKQRHDKIHAKNEKLNENRAKRIEREKQAKEEGTGEQKQQNSFEDSVHPSRRGRVPGMAY